MEEAKAEVLAYHNEHGRRPSQETNPEWNQWHQWLRARGKSLSQLCDELGLARAVKAA
jgi:hypothetical protein